MNVNVLRKNVSMYVANIQFMYMRPAINTHIHSCPILLKSATWWLCLTALLFQCKAAHRWIEIQPVQQELAKFWSMFSCPLLLNKNVGKPFSISRKSRYPNIRSWCEGVLHPPCLCGWRNPLFVFFEPTGWKKKTTHLKSADHIWLYWKQTVYKAT